MSQKTWWPYTYPNRTHRQRFELQVICTLVKHHRKKGWEAKACKELLICHLPPTSLSVPGGWDSFSPSPRFRWGLGLSTLPPPPLPPPYPCQKKAAECKSTWLQSRIGSLIMRYPQFMLQPSGPLFFSLLSLCVGIRTTCSWRLWLIFLLYVSNKTF